MYWKFDVFDEFIHFICVIPIQLLSTNGRYNLSQINFLISFCNLTFKCAPTGWFYNPTRIRNSNSKISNFSQFYILIFSSLWKIEARNFNSDPRFLNLIKLGRISPATYFINCENIGRSHMIEVLICDLSQVLLENVS